MNLDVALRGDRSPSSKSVRATACRTSSAVVSTADKIAFVNRLSAAGLPVIEVSAFVSPKWVPQMADAAEVFAGITRRPGTRYTALVPNLAGLERALAAGVDEIAIFAAATETFSRKNINQSIDESLATYARGLRPRAAPPGCACAATCRRRSAVRSKATSPPRAVARRRRAAARPRRVRGGGQRHDRHRASRPGAARARRGARRACRSSSVALHFHDTRGTALANVLAALPFGVTTFDASAGGLGGCPYAPGAAGNLATDDLVYMLDGLGIETGVSLAALSEASAFIAARLDHPLPSRYAQAARTSQR